MKDYKILTDPNEKFKIDWDNHNLIGGDNAQAILENWIDAEPRLEYAWVCPDCHFINVKIGNKDLVECVECKVKIEKNDFSFKNLGKINAIMQTPDRMIKTMTDKQPKKRIEAFPVVLYGWMCPACGKWVYSIPPHRDGLCMCPHCFNRFTHSTFKHKHEEMVKRFVIEAEAKVFCY